MARPSVMRTWLVPSRALSWWASLLPAFVMAGVEFIRHDWLESMMLGNLVVAALVGAGAALYVHMMARYLRYSERRLSAAREETAVLQERDRVAREMHDNVSQALFYLGVRLEDVQRQLGEGDCDDAGQLLTEVRRDLDQTYERVRTAIADLRRHPAPRTLSAALAALAGDLSHQFPLSVDLTAAADAEVVLPEPVLQQLLGAAREALVNAAKHAGTGKAIVSARTQGGMLTVTIADEGPGFDPAAATGGFGLIMMQERMELAGGRMRADTAPGRGACIRLELPLEEVSDATHRTRGSGR